MEIFFVAGILQNTPYNDKSKAIRKTYVAENTITFTRILIAYVCTFHDQQWR